EELKALYARSRPAAAPTDLARLSDDELKALYARSRPASGPSDGILSNQSDDTLASGSLKNLGTSVIKSLAHIPGVYGDLREFVQYGSDRLFSKLHGESMEDLQRRRQEFEKRVPIPKVPSGHDIAQPVLNRTGEYQPTTEAGKLGATAVESGLSMA